MMRLGLTARTVIFVMMAATTVGLCHVFPNAAMNPEAGIVMRLPEVVPGQDGEEIPVSEEEKYWLPGDTETVKRRYFPYGASEEMKSWASLSATLILSGGDKRSLHRPEVCLTAQGWSIPKREVVKLDTGGGPLEVMDLHLVREAETQDGRTVKIRAHYVYWWVGRDVSTPHAWQRIMLSAANNIFRNINDRWAYPSVMVTVLGEGAEAEGAARERAFDFIRQYAPTFQKSLGAEASTQ
ncbi:MAG: exosortase-associated EpsI family protein [Verrucomicrobiae bacterium]|nr:exosortase-associated EpsI family protein [Verrucomicrobiae bacterium]